MLNKHINSFPITKAKYYWNTVCRSCTSVVAIRADDANAIDALLEKVQFIKILKRPIAIAH